MNRLSVRTDKQTDGQEQWKGSVQRIVLAYVRTDEQLLLTSLGKATQVRIAGCSDTGWGIERQVAMKLILCTRKMVLQFI